MANNLNLNILGFPAVNGDLQVVVRDSSGETVRTARPFLDGTVKMPNFEPGAYELAVLHPNITLPVIQQPIRILPVGDTQVSVLIDPAKFKNTPIADIPDANLGPVRDRTQSVSETVLPLAQKQPGEAITAQDWNLMATGIRDLAMATTELTRLVTPTGHDHAELVTKIEEMVGNFSELLSTLGAAMTELQRQIQNLRVRKQVEDVLDQAVVDPPIREEFLLHLHNLDAAVTEPPSGFGRTARTTGVQLGARLQALIDEHAADDVFLNSPSVKTLQQSVELLKGIRSTTYSGELAQLRNVDRQMGTGGLSDVLAGKR
jgi:hypothetical protein